ncbi:MAG: hypothetical protein HY043_02485 [Verrucomicrobia bacterium]|nr:hypothetical protein [Verrucomicrobiota bacterium]
MLSRKLFATFAFAVLALSVRGQGTIQFANHVGGVVDAPVFGTDGATKLQGPAYSAQLYAGPSMDALMPVGEAAPFGSGIAAGYFRALNPAVVIPMVAPGAIAFCQVRVWDTAKGTNYDVAFDAGSAHGESEIVQLTTGGAGTPPSLPTPLLGLKSFQLVPPVLGTIDFRNFVPGTLDAPVFALDGTTRLSGTGFLAQLYAGVTTNDFQPAGEPAPFGEGAAAGYWDAGADSTVVLKNIRAGVTAQVQVRVWPAQLGKTFEEAVHNFGFHGESPVLTVKIDNHQMPVLLGGLRTFRLKPPTYGTVEFNNYIPGEVDWRIFGPYFLKPLEGANFLAQLYAGRTEAESIPVGSPVPFGTGQKAGYLSQVPTRQLFCRTCWREKKPSSPFACGTQTCGLHTKTRPAAKDLVRALPSKPEPAGMEPHFLLLPGFSSPALAFSPAGQLFVSATTFLT